MTLNKFLIFIITFFSIQISAQTNIYVATNGNDNTGNGSISSPYATINKAGDIANAAINSNPTVAVNILVRGGTYRNASFSTSTILDPNSYNPQGAGEAVWKTNTTTGTTVRLNNINGRATAWITIKPYNNEAVTIEGDGDNAFSIRNCTYIRVEGFEIKGVMDRIPLELAWKYWGTYRYLSGGNYIYGDRKLEICTLAGISNSSDIPPNVLKTDTTYTNLPNINSLNVERPGLFISKGLLVQLSNNIEVLNCEVHHFPGGGMRVTQSDYVTFKGNIVHHNSSRASVGTHGLVIEGLTADSGNNSVIEKMWVSNNIVYSNYNECYSWVQSKTICTTVIDEGKGIALLRTSPSESNFNGIIRVENNICYDNGKSGIHTNDVWRAIIVNNTVYDNAHTNIYNPLISGGNNAGISIQSSDSIKIINNLVTVTNGLSPALIALSEGQSCSGEFVSNNIIFGGGQSSFIGGFTIADPQFINKAANNVALQPTSPAIGAGTTLYAPQYDFNGNLRSNPPTVGAFELQLAKINAKVFLEGAFDSNTGKLSNYYGSVNLLPTTQPYNNFTHLNSGGENTTNAILSANAGDNSIVDWIFLELRSKTNPATRLHTRAGLLQKDGDIVDMDGVSPITFNSATPDDYYIAIRHRNHLGFRTANTVALSNTPVSLNFTNNSITLYGSTPNTLVATNVYAMSSGDSNKDGSIDAFDTILWDMQNGLFDNYSLNSDYNLDGSVDAFDSILWELNNGKFEELD